MTSGHAKEGICAVWVGTFVLGLAFRLVGVERDSTGWAIANWAWIVSTGVLGIAFLALLANEYHSVGRLWAELRPWVWSLLGIAAIGGLYWLLTDGIG